MKKRISDVYVHENYRALIREDFFLRTQENLNYSLRAYARNLSLSPSLLSLVLQNKRHLSEKNLFSVMERIGLDFEETNFVRALFLREKKQADIQAESLLQQHRPVGNLEEPSEENRNLLCKTVYHTLVFNAFDYPQLRKDPDQIPLLLNISSDHFAEIMGELKMAQLIAISSNGEVTPLRDNIVLGDDSHQELLRHVLELKSYCQELLENHGKVLDLDNSISIVYHLHLNSEAKQKMIEAFRKFQFELLKINESCTKPDQYFVASIEMLKCFELKQTMGL